MIQMRMMIKCVVLLYFQIHIGAILSIGWSYMIQMRMMIKCVDLFILSDTHWCNPQYRLVLHDTDEDDD